MFMTSIINAKHHARQQDTETPQVSYHYLFHMVILPPDLLVCRRRRQCSGSAPSFSCACSRSRRWSPWGWPSKLRQCPRWTPAAWPRRWSALPDLRCFPRRCCQWHRRLRRLAWRPVQLAALEGRNRRWDEKQIIILLLYIQLIFICIIVSAISNH